MYYSPQHDVHKNAKYLLNHFENIFEQFRKQQIVAAISAQKRSKLSLGALISESRKIQLLDTLVSSKGTLLIVPHMLAEHWQEQIHLHVNLSACSTKIPLIFHHRKSKTHRRNHNTYLEVSDLTAVSRLCNEECTHFPFLFIDECNEKLPSEHFLAMFHIVLTTTKVRMMLGILSKIHPSYE